MNALRFAIRQLLKNPGFTAGAVLKLATCIGGSLAIFAVVSVFVVPRVGLSVPTSGQVRIMKALSAVHVAP